MGFIDEIVFADIDALKQRWYNWSGIELPDISLRMRPNCFNTRYARDTSYTPRDTSNNIRATSVYDGASLSEFPYYLRETRSMMLVMHNGLDKYLSDVRLNASDYREMVNNKINEPVSRPAMQGVVDTISSIVSRPDDRARIAISLVQHIPYDYSQSEKIDKGLPVVLKFPYQVLFQNKGICTEKSFLLIALLKGLNFGVAYLRMPKHAAVGIKTPFKYGFVETTTKDSVRPMAETVDCIPIAEGRTYMANKSYDA